MHNKIRNYVSQQAAMQGIDDLSEDESLLDAGIIDSVTMVDLIAMIETELGISVDEDEMIPENFETLGAIIAFAESKSATAGA